MSDATVRLDADNEFQPDALLPSDKQGHIQSRVFPDLRLNAAALLTDDLTAVIQTTQAAIQSQ